VFVKDNPASYKTPAVSSKSLVGDRGQKISTEKVKEEMIYKIFKLTCGII
jgi:hypothetical protein